MKKTKVKRKIKRNRGYRNYHKKKIRNKSNKRKIFYVFLSLLLMCFVPYKFQNPVQIWKDEEEVCCIIDEPLIDEDEEEKNDSSNNKEGDDGKIVEENIEEDIKVYTDSPYFVMDGRWNTDYKRTYYDVDTEGGIIASYGKYWNDENMRVENNFIQYYDEQYGWINVYALNIDQVKEYGTVINSTVLGSIIEVKLPDGSFHYGIVLDVCGACAKDKIIDVWVKNQYEAKDNQTHIDNGVEFRFRRFSFDGEDIIYKKE